MTKLLQQWLVFSGSYRQGLSLHLPMEWQAMRELGMAAETLQTADTSRYELLQDDGRELAHWQDGVADATAEAALRRYLQGHPECWPQVLQAALAHPLSGGFHGVIRLAYALRSGYEPELIAALAYALTCRYVLPTLAAGQVDDPDMASLWQRLAGRKVATRPGLITADIEYSLQQVAAELPARLPAESARASRQRARQLFLASRDFSALHLLTGWEACFSLAQHLGLDEVPDETLQPLQWAALGLWLYCDTPELAEDEPSATKHDQKAATLDGHSIKLACSAQRLAAFDADVAWRQLALSVLASGWRAAQP